MGSLLPGSRQGTSWGILWARDGLVGSIPEGKSMEMPLMYQKGPRPLSSQG